MASKKEMVEELIELGVKDASEKSSSKELEAQLKKAIKATDNTKKDEPADGDDDRITPEGEGVEGDDDSDADSKKDEPADGDYLRQYQYKIIDSKAYTGGKKTDPDKGSRAEKMKASLLKQPRVSTMISLKDQEDPNICLSVNLNGYRLDIPKNEVLDLPVQIVEIITDSQKQTNAALNKFRIDRSKETEDALA